MNMVPVEEFSNRILSYVEGLNEDMVAAYVADAVIQFLKDTRLSVEYHCIGLKACVSSYKLHTRWRIYQVSSVDVLTCTDAVVPSRYYDYRVEKDTIYFNFGTQCSCGFYAPDRAEISLVTLPKRDSVEFPEFLYEDWLEAIVAYVLYKVYSMHGSKYANASAAQVHALAYNGFVKDAGLYSASRHKAFEAHIENPMVSP